MKIKELISELLTILEEQGDLEVEIPDGEGGYNVAGDVYYYTYNSGTSDTRWAVQIDPDTTKF